MEASFLKALCFNKIYLRSAVILIFFYVNFALMIKASLCRR